MIRRGFANIIARDVPKTMAWYVDLLGWQTEFQSDWFVHLKAENAPGVELGIIDASHEIVSGFTTAGEASGITLTFVVDDVDSTYEQALSLGYDVIEAPTNLFYGQRRMVLRDINGTLVDVSSECPPSEEFLASLPHRSIH